MEAEDVELLYSALRSEVGIIVQTNDPERLRQRLYRVRKEDPELADLSFKLSPTAPASELWIIKKGRDAQE